MEGREPRPPEDWDDDGEPSVQAVGSTTAKTEPAAGGIGGPAEEH